MTRASSPSPAREDAVHATCIAFGARGVLLLGPSGSGKSDLALRAVADQGAKLVADDLVRLTARRGAIWASAPAAARRSGLLGAIEARGLGILRLPPAARAGPVRLVLAVALVPPDQVERLPQLPWGLGGVLHTADGAGPPAAPFEGWERLNVSVPVLRLAPFEASAALKLRLAATHNLRLAAGGRSGSIKRLA